MNPERYAAEEIRALGRRLTSGSWSREASPMTAAEALAVIGRAAALVLEDGARSVLAEARRRMKELAAK